MVQLMRIQSSGILGLSSTKCIICYLCKSISLSANLLFLKNEYIHSLLLIALFNMTGVQQTQIVFNNISIISSKFFFLALHICQRQSLSKFFLKIHRVSKVRFMRFYYLKTDFIRILLIKPHKSNF